MFLISIGACIVEDGGPYVMHFAFSVLDNYVYLKNSLFAEAKVYDVLRIAIQRHTLVCDERPPYQN